MIPRRIPLTFATLSWAASLVLAPSASALPATADSANWRSSQNNCYNYALNKKDDDMKQPGDYPWPSGVGSSWSAERWCAKVDSLAQADHLVHIPWSEGQPIPVVGADTNLVALAIHLGGKGDAGTGDFHWYRKNGDGTWSQKHGRSPATRMYRDDQNQRHVLTDPRDIAQREGYDAFCGFLGVLKSTTTQQQQHDVPPPGGCLMITLVKSGPEDHSIPVTGSALAPLHSHLPTISVGNQIPDPHWLEPLAGAYRGFAVWPDNPSLGFPTYLRVFQGAVAVYSNLDGTSITYYGDNHGLESYLSTLGPTAAAPGWTPRASALVALALLIAGVGVLRRRRGEDIARG